MKILSIGNSFSNDAQGYLHNMALSDGVEIEAVNLFIGGCSLSMHYDNMLSGEKAYSLEINGETTGLMVSLEEALLRDTWDVITIQQVSQESPYYKTYQPYLDEVIKYVKKLAPNAKLAFHQTWAYEQDSKRLNEELKYTDYKDMLRDIVAAGKQAADAIKADYIIPSGEVFGAMLESGVKKVHRDTFHANFGVGRYALALTWYKILANGNVQDNTFKKLFEPITEEEIAIAKKCVLEVTAKYQA